MTRYLSRSRPRYRITGLVVVLGVCALLPVAAGILVIVGAVLGDRVEDPWVLVSAAAFTVGGFGFAAVRQALSPVDDGRGVPDSAAEAAPLQVRSRLGVVFWLMVALTAAAVWLVCAVLVKLAEKTPQQRVEDLGSSGLAAVGSTILMIGSVSLVVLVSVALPVRIMRWRNRIHLYLTSDGIGWTPAGEDDPGYVEWRRVRSVVHSSRDVRGIVYTHRWRIEYDEDLCWKTIEYPAGATPRPRYIRKRIGELAPFADIA